MVPQTYIFHWRAFSAMNVAAGPSTDCTPSSKNSVSSATSQCFAPAVSRNFAHRARSPLPWHTATLTSRGAIGCPTCHDPHRHRAEGLAEDVPGYFLRVADTRGFLCADCHASSSLMRYKFFHSEKSRR